MTRRKLPPSIRVVPEHNVYDAYQLTQQMIVDFCFKNKEVGIPGVIVLAFFDKEKKWISPETDFTVLTMHGNYQANVGDWVIRNPEHDKKNDWSAYNEAVIKGTHNNLPIGYIEEHECDF
jgi:hypothetical protein